MHRPEKYKMESITGQPSFYNVLMKLQVMNITEEDFGKYKCLAKNSQGESSGEIKIYGKRHRMIHVFGKCFCHE